MDGRALLQPATALLRLIAGLLLALPLTGCIPVDFTYDTRIGPTGAGTRTITVETDPELLKELDNEDLFPPSLAWHKQTSGNKLTGTARFRRPADLSYDSGKVTLTTSGLLVRRYEYVETIVFEEKPQEFSSDMATMDLILPMITFTMKVSLPGKIVETNGSREGSDTARWQFDGQELKDAGSYTMRAVSKQVNLLVVILGVAMPVILIVLAAIIALLASRGKQRKATVAGAGSEEAVCENCGTPLRPDSSHCSYCGREAP